MARSDRSANSAGTVNRPISGKSGAPSAASSPSRVWSRSRKRMLLVVLDQFDAVEDAAADVAGALERVAPVGRNDQCLLARLQPPASRL